MSNVVKGTRGPGRLRAAVNLTLGCVLLGGCSSGSDRFSSASFGSGYGTPPRVNEAAAPSPRIADNAQQPAQSRPAYYQADSPPATSPSRQAAISWQARAQTRSGGYLQVSRVDLPPLQQRQPSQGTKMADGYGPYNQPPLPDGTYTGPRVYTPYDGPRGDAPPAGTFIRPKAAIPAATTASAPPPPPPSSYYRHSDAPPPPAYAPRDETRVYEPKPDRSYAGRAGLTMATSAPAYGRAQEDDAPASRRPWSGRTDGEMVAVAPGDTLYTLARRYGVTVDMIARANGLSTVYVRPGTKLFIPRADPASYAQAPSRAPAKADQTAAAPAAKDPSRQALASADKPNPGCPPRRPGAQAPAAGSTRLADKGGPQDLAERACPGPAGP